MFIKRALDVFVVCVRVLFEILIIKKLVGRVIYPDNHYKKKTFYIYLSS